MGFLVCYFGFFLGRLAEWLLVFFGSSGSPRHDLERLGWAALVFGVFELPEQFFYLARGMLVDPVVGSRLAPEGIRVFAVWCWRDTDFPLGW